MIASLERRLERLERAHGEPLEVRVTLNYVAVDGTVRNADGSLYMEPPREEAVIYITLDPHPEH